MGRDTIGTLSSWRSAMRRVALLAFLPVLLIRGELPPPRPAPTRADLAEQAYLRRLPIADPLTRGQPLAYWRAAARTRGITFGGWAGHAEFRDGPETSLVFIWDPEAIHV